MAQTTIQTTLIKHVYGNVMRIAIPLTMRIRTMTDGVETETEEDFYPNPTKPVVVSLMRDGGFKKDYTPTVEGNLVTFEDDGTLDVGIYQVTVKCYDMQGQPCRYMVRAIIQIVSATIDAGIRAGIEFDSVDYVLEGAVYFYAKGDKGDPFTYEDFTQEQILDLKRPALDAAAVAMEKARLANDAAQLAAEKAEAARLAAINAKADYVGQDNYVYHWNVANQQYEKTDLYVKGEHGVDVTSVIQTQTSTESEGINIVRVTLSDGSYSEFEIRNGKAITPTFDVENKTLIFNK